MTYETLDLAALDVGKPLKKSIFTKTRSNFGDHETRIDTLEGGAGKIIVADLEICGYISHYSPSDLVGVATFRAPADFNLLECVITIMDAPNSFDSLGASITTSEDGELSIDLKKSTDGGATFASILTTKPAIIDGENGAGTSSNDSPNTAAVFSDVAIDQDDFLRVDVTGLKDTQASFHISIYGELN